MPGPASRPSPGGGRPSGGAPGSRSGGSPSGPGGGKKTPADKEKKGIKDILKIVGMVIVVIIALAMFALRGCNFSFLSSIPNSLSTGTAPNISGGLGGMLGSKHTDADDRSKYAQVQDINGNIFTTVIEVVPINTTEIRVDDVKSLVEGRRWYQMIVVDNMATKIQEKAYIFFPPDVTLSTLNEVTAGIAATGSYTATVMTPDTYNAYLADPNLSNNIYYNETTYYGPAAKS